MRVYILFYVLKKILNDCNNKDEFKTFIKNYNITNLNKYTFIILDNDISLFNLQYCDNNRNDIFKIEDYMIKIIINNNNIEINNYKLFYTPGIIEINDEMMIFINKIYKSGHDYGHKYLIDKCKYIDNTYYDYYDINKYKNIFDNDYNNYLNYVKMMGEKLYLYEKLNNNK